MKIAAINNFFYTNKQSNVKNQNTQQNRINSHSQPASDCVLFGGNMNTKALYETMMIDINNMFYGHRPVGFHSPEGYCAIINKFDAKKYCSLHGESAIFLMEDPNQILKISCAPYEDYIPEFHAPEFGRGVIKTDKPYPILNRLKEVFTDKFYWVIQKRGELHISQADEEMLVKRAIEAGYDVQDIKYDQFAYFDGEPKFVDLGCIRQKGKSKDFWDKVMFNK